MATIEQLEQGLIRAKSEGNQQAMQILGAELVRQRQASQPTGRLPNMESQLRGLTLGISDPVIAAGRAGIGAMTGGLPFKQGYQQERQAIAQGKQQTGLLGTAQEVVSGMLTGGGAARLMPEMVKRHPYLSSIPLGAATGGTYSATQQENPLGGAITGAVAGPAGQALGAGITRAASPVLRSIANRQAPQRAAEVLRRDVMEPAGLTTQDVATEMARRGPGTMPIETMGDYGRALGMDVTQASRPARQMFRTAFDKRLNSRMQWDRLRGDVKRLMGGKSGEKFFKAADDVIAQRRAEATPLYKQAFDEQVAASGVQDLNKKWMRYIDEGIPDKNLPALSGSNLESLVKRSAGALKKGKGVKTKIGDLDNVQVALRQKADAMQKAGKGREALILRTMRGDLLEITDSASPVYQQARSVYRDKSMVLEAMDQGKKILREDAEITEKALQGMSKSEHDAYLLGAAKALRDATATKTPGFFKNNPLIQERLAHAFPDEKALTEFLEVSVRREATLKDLNQKILEGSMTAEKTNAQKRGMIMAAKEILTGETGNLLTRTAGAIGQALRKKYPPQVAEELAQTLLTDGPEEFAKRASLRLNPGDVDILVRSMGSAAQTGAVIGAQ